MSTERTPRWPWLAPGTLAVVAGSQVVENGSQYLRPTGWCLLAVGAAVLSSGLTLDGIRRATRTDQETDHG